MSVRLSPTSAKVARIYSYAATPKSSYSVGFAAVGEWQIAVAVFGIVALLLINVALLTQEDMTTENMTGYFGANIAAAVVTTIGFILCMFGFSDTMTTIKGLADVNDKFVFLGPDAEAALQSERVLSAYTDKLGSLTEYTKETEERVKRSLQAQDIPKEKIEQVVKELSRRAQASKSGSGSGSASGSGSSSSNQERRPERSERRSDRVDDYNDDGPLNDDFFQKLVADVSR